MFDFTFTSRETYLADVAAWKALYAEHSQQIRDTRRAFNEAQSAHSKGEGNRYNDIERLRSQVARLRDEATDLIGRRHQSKVEAQRQYLEARENRAAQEVPSIAA
jgi:hypothetical protein